MMLISATRNKLVLQLGKREKHLLFELLKLYPRIPSAHHKLSKSSRLPDQDASQKLLEEALTEQRSENKRQLQALLADPGRLQENEAGCRLSLSRGDVEWLLQVLNDIRVGSWVLLGSPEPRLELKSLTEKTAPDFWAMELAGEFQMELLAVLAG